jgi:hypothetical protein
MPDHAWSRQELLEQIAAAITQTRAIADAPGLGRVLIELEDVAARLKGGEALTTAYRQTLYFDVIATRELDDAADTHLPYLDLLSEIAAAIDELDPLR